MKQASLLLRLVYALACQRGIGGFFPVFELTFLAVSVVAHRNFRGGDGLLHQLLAVRADLIQAEKKAASVLKAVHPGQRQSARNLIHYLAFRQHDLQDVQSDLAALGLSSLGRLEGHVLATLDAVVENLQRLLGKKINLPETEPGISFEAGKSLLKSNTGKLLGPRPRSRFVRIMVTMPTEAAQDSALLEKLLGAGMDCIRINTAHDDRAAWEQMIKRLRIAQSKAGRQCRVLIDLAGPKLRTGPLEPGPAFVKWRPERDVLGRVLRPAQIRLVPAEKPMPANEKAAATVPLPVKWLAHLRRGDLLRFTDVRKKKRSLTITKVSDDSRWAESTETTYLQTGTKMEIQRSGEAATDHGAEVGSLPRTETTILLKKKDVLILTRAPIQGRSAQRDQKGRIRRPAHIGCASPAIFRDVAPGDEIWFDDGKIGGVVEKAEARRLFIRVTRARPNGEKLRADKSINLPGTILRLPALTQTDAQNLPFVVKHSDLVGYSFVQSAADVLALQGRLRKLQAQHLGIVLKIETRWAFEQLPGILLAALRSPVIAVMIARGDLAVECGYERLAEIQEELLWICEAAHVPVIWATQVLERLARTGLPSRAEITDAAMSARAECVMLNKGPHMVEAVRALKNILCRMQAHQNKKTSKLRSLGLARRFNPASNAKPDHFQ